MAVQSNHAQEIYQKMRDALWCIHKRTSLKPSVGIILGSGLGSIGAHIQDAVTLPYSEIPHFFPTSVDGHSGQMTLGLFQGVPTVFLQGRFHFYEGYSMEEVVFPTRTICGLGIQTLILTNLAGGINPQFKSGDVMVIEDHLNLMGSNPLKGPNLSQLGPRFPDLSEPYNKNTIQLFKQKALESGIEVKSGVYAAVLGPTYETPAEVNMLRVLGADAVGMSTVPETIAATHLGVKVAGLTCITNLASSSGKKKLGSAEISEIALLGAQKMSKIISLSMSHFDKI